MQNICLAGRDAVALFESPLVKNLDADFEFKQHITRSDTNFMAYVGESIEYPPVEGSCDGVPVISRQEACDIAQRLFSKTPLYVMVRKQEYRRNSRRLACLVRPHSIIRDEIINLGGDLFCTSPELTLLQMLKGCTDVEVIVLLSLFFGVFAKDADRGALIPRRRVTDPRRVLSFLDSCGELGKRMPNDVKRLKRLIPKAVVNAASPKEIECALRLGLPLEEGGCGFGLPQMNYRLGIPSTKRHRYCDMYWPDQNVAAEYLGAEEHLTLESLEADALHYNDLASINIPVFTITSGQTRSITSFNRVARQIGQRLRNDRDAQRTAAHRRGLFPADAAFRDRQRALKNDLDQALSRFGY